MTVWRYIREAVDLLAEAAPTLTQAMRRIGGLAYEVLLRRQGGVPRASGAVGVPFYGRRVPTRMREGQLGSCQCPSHR